MIYLRRYYNLDFLKAGLQYLLKELYFQDDFTTKLKNDAYAHFIHWCFVPSSYPSYRRSQTCWDRFILGNKTHSGNEKRYLILYMIRDHFLFIRFYFYNLSANNHICNSLYRIIGRMWHVFVEQMLWNSSTRWINIKQFD